MLQHNAATALADATAPL